MLISIKDLNIELGSFALRNINLDVGFNEFFVLMGPTGAGKTVLLEAIAGLVPVKSGKIIINGKNITDLPPEKRFVGIVYQDYTLFPHLTVEKNITYGCRYHGISDRIAAENLKHLIEILDLSRIKDRLPVNLSGGELQRTALARALMVNPGVLLLDEPLSSLDPNFREGIRNALKMLHSSTETTFMMVTHDFAEALSLAKRAAVMSHGKIEQVGHIDEIFRRPDSKFVADFVGMKNLFPAKFADTKAFINSLEIDLGKRPQNGNGYIALRPEDISISRTAPASTSIRNCYKGIVTDILDQGFCYEVHASVNDVIFKSLITKRSLFDLAIEEGNEIFLAFKATAVHML